MKKRKRSGLRFVISFVATSLIVGVPAIGFQIYRYRTRPWYEKYSLIAHSMGGIDGMDYTNSKEAFLFNYEKGYRVFEVDFRKTSDGVLVVRHDWRKNDRDAYTKKNIPTAEEFLSSPLYGKYTALSFTDVLKLAQEYPDAYFITDTKQADLQSAEETMAQMAQAALALGLTDVLQKQFIIQIYNEQMYTAAKQWVNPDNIIYTVYQLKPEEYTQAALFCAEHDIPVVAVRYTRWNEEVQAMLDTLELVSAVHTINDLQEAEYYMLNGVACLYSDFLDPHDF